MINVQSCCSDSVNGAADGPLQLLHLFVIVLYISLLHNNLTGKAYCTDILKWKTLKGSHSDSQCLNIVVHSDNVSNFIFAVSEMYQNRNFK